jgi:hypothetical protein
MTSVSRHIVAQDTQRPKTQCPWTTTSCEIGWSAGGAGTRARGAMIGAGEARVGVWGEPELELEGEPELDPRAQRCVGILL